MSKPVLHHIEKEFLYTDETVNSYGFRLLTSGYLKDEYSKNPIGFHMHTNREDGVLVRWRDLRVDGNKVYGKPSINLTHPRGQRTVDEIEAGVLNAASVGKIVVLETSTDPKMSLKDQTGPTVTKWFHREISLVDIPGNFNALSLCDADGNPINLADFKTPKIGMVKIEYTAAQLGAMNLSADATDVAVSVAFDDLVARAGRADAAEQELKDLKVNTTADKVKNLCDAALGATKITVALHTKLSAKYAEDPEGLKDLLDDMPVYQSVNAQVLTDPKAKKLADLMAKPWDELHKNDLVADLKALDEAAYLEKRAEKYPA